MIHFRQADRAPLAHSGNIVGRWINPVLIITTLALIMATSNVGFSLWVLSPLMAAPIAGAYIFMLLASMGWPSFKLYRASAVLAGVIFLSRGGGFLHLVIDLNQWHLLGAVAERIALTMLVLQWHFAQARLAVAAEVVDDRTPQTQELRLLAERVTGEALLHNGAVT